MTLSQAELNAMRRVTPTGLAEEANAARRSPRVVRKTGPSGIQIPGKWERYRPTIEQSLLRDIAARAHRAFAARHASAADEATAAACIARSLRERFPPDDMDVLRRYGFASETRHAIIGLGIYGAHQIALPEPMVLPQQAAVFTVDNDPPARGRPGCAAVPTETIDFFDRVVEVRALKNREFMDAVHWPGQVKAREHRWPLWDEIEVAWPRIAAWLAEQRGETA